jgi:hypothetical protein
LPAPGAPANPWPMEISAVIVILLFIAVMGAINYLEYHRFD